MHRAPVPARRAPGEWGPPPPLRWPAPRWGDPTERRGSRSASDRCSAPCSPGRCVGTAAGHAASRMHKENDESEERQIERVLWSLSALVFQQFHHKSKYLYVNLTFFMNKLSCLEHLSTLSLSTEMSEMMLHRKKARWLTQIVIEVQQSSNTLQIRPHNLHAKAPCSCRHTHTPYVGELGRVVVSVDETEKDLEHQQPNLWILC